MHLVVVGMKAGRYEGHQGMNLRTWSQTKYRHLRADKGMAEVLSLNNESALKRETGKTRGVRALRKQTGGNI